MGNVKINQTLVVVMKDGRERYVINQFASMCIINKLFHDSFNQSTIAEILTSNSVGTQLFFLGCNQDNNRGSNFITKKKICLVLPEKEISNHRN